MNYKKKQPSDTESLFGNRKMSNFEKVELIREQVRDIEKKTKQ